MAGPILQAHAAFDAKLDATFTFYFPTSPYPIASTTMRVVNNYDGTAVGEFTYVSSESKFVLSGNPTGADTGCINGNTYDLSVYVTYADESYSDWSNTITVSCYATPTFSITVGSTVGNSYVSIPFTYEEADPGDNIDDLDCYQLVLEQEVSASKWKEVYRSGWSYDVGDYSNMSVQIAGLADNGTYRAQGLGVTCGGTQLATTKSLFNVDYILPPVYTDLLLENNNEGGNIKITYNVDIITGECTVDPPVYETVGTEHYIDLTATGGNAVVTFEEALDIPDEFFLSCIGKDFEWNNTFLKIGRDPITGLTCVMVKRSVSGTVKIYVEVYSKRVCVLSNALTYQASDDTATFMIQITRVAGGLINVLLTRQA